MSHHPFGQDGAAPADNAHHPLHGRLDMLLQKAGMKRHEIHALPRLFLDDRQQEFDIEFLDVSADPPEGLIDRDRAEGHGAGRQHGLALGCDIRADAQIHHTIRARGDRDSHFPQFFPLGRSFVENPMFALILVRNSRPMTAGLKTGMGRIGRDYSMPTRHLLANFFRRHILLSALPTTWRELFCPCALLTTEWS